MTWLHDKTGISKNTLSVMANNDSKGIQFETLEKICNALNILPNDLIEIEDHGISFYSIGRPIKLTENSVYTTFVMRAFTEENSRYDPITDDEIVRNSAYPPLDYLFFTSVYEKKDEYQIVISVPDKKSFQQYGEDLENSFEKNNSFFSTMDYDEKINFAVDVATFIVNTSLKDLEKKLVDIRIRLDLHASFNSYSLRKMKTENNKIKLVPVNTTFILDEFGNMTEEKKE